MNLGLITSAASQPITGSDMVTTGYSPDTMHVNPVTGVPFYDEQQAAIAAQQAAAVAAAQPQGMSTGTLILLAAVAWGAWYGYKHGWFNDIVGNF